MRGFMQAVVWAALVAVPGVRAGETGYTVSVWSRVLFGPDGQVQEQSLLDEASYPAAFVEQVQRRVAQARIPPLQRDGRAVSLRIGVEMRFRVDQDDAGQGTVRVIGVDLGPLPLRRSVLPLPDDLRKEGWEGAAIGICRVGLEGVCTEVDVQALPGMPVSVRRHMKASLQGWRFESPQLDGQPIESESRLRVVYRVDEAASRPADFRQDAFTRLINKHF